LAALVPRATPLSSRTIGSRAQTNAVMPARGCAEHVLVARVWGVGRRGLPLRGVANPAMVAASQLRRKVARNLQKPRFVSDTTVHCRPDTAHIIVPSSNTISCTLDNTFDASVTVTLERLPNHVASTRWD
jgi:hypothetical protein